MYLKVGDAFADQDLKFLAELLEVIDAKVVEVSTRIASSIDPISEGLTDRGEYFIGVGLCAIQQYLTDTLTLTGVGKKRAFDLGPWHSENYTFVSVVNAAANWWKHSSEWFGKSVENGLATQTQKIVVETAGSLDYPLSNVLAKLLDTSDITLSALLPNLVLWRSAVDQESGKYA
ncbi:hypothetical protein [Marinobacter salexigens]|uniref:hypothetical protein n=1 Tax=Marinobacter salexigens TaxID=1925763 RepID=UPI000C2882F6|nr:hypothetical protein [Marinobacter salexigens]